MKIRVKQGRNQLVVVDLANDASLEALQAAARMALGMNAGAVRLSLNKRVNPGGNQLSGEIHSCLDCPCQQARCK